MKKGKRLLLLLAATLTLVLAFTVTASAEDYVEYVFDRTLGITFSPYEWEYGSAASSYSLDVVADHVTQRSDPAHSSPYTYTVERHTFEAEPTVEYTVDPLGESVEPGDYTGAWAETEPKNAGTYGARVKFKHKSTDTWNHVDYSDTWEDYNKECWFDTKDHYEYATVTVKPKEVSNISWTGESFVYNGSAQAPKAVATDTVDSDVCEVEMDIYKRVSGSADELLTGGAVDVNDGYVYVAKATSSKNSNYVLGATLVNPEKEFSITKKPVALTWPGEDSYVYNGTEQTPVATPSDTGAILSYVKEYDETGNTGTIGKDVGKYKVTASLDPDKDVNKNFVMDKEAVTEKKFEIAALEAKLAWTKTKLVYDGSLQGPEATVENLMPKTGDKDSCTVTVTGQKENAGTYVATASELSNKNYKLPANPTVNFTILPMPVKVKWSETTEFNYDGQEHTLDAKAVNGVGTEIADLKVVTEVSGAADRRWTPSGGIDAGAYTATAVKLTNSKGNIAPNYALVSSNSTDYAELDPAISTADYTPTYTKSFTIKPIDAVIAWDNTALTYNGSKQAPAAKVSNLKTAAGYDVPDDCTVDVTGEQKDAGDSYTATADSLKGAQAYNYTLPANTTAGFSIAKCDLKVTANPKSISYGDDPDNAGVKYDTLQGSDTPGGIGLNVSYAYNYVKNGRPGSYRIIPEGVSSLTNYNVTYVPGTLTVSDKAKQIVAAAASKGKKKLKFTWNAVNGAAKYEIYLGKCNTKGRKYKVKKIATVAGSPLTYTKNKLKAKTAYKFYVVAKDARGNVISQSAVGHVFTSKYKGKYTNAKSISVNASAVTLDKGGKYTLSASYTKAKKSKKLAGKGHAPLTRFVSENPSVATVDANGVVTGVSTGWCRVYVQGVDGIWKAVQVSVR